MSTFSHLTQASGLLLVHRQDDTEKRRALAEDGLGCMRGLAFALIFSLGSLLLIMASAWGIWRLFHR